jgi:hypothetical protein
MPTSGECVSRRWGARLARAHGGGPSREESVARYRARGAPGVPAPSRPCVGGRASAPVPAMPAGTAGASPDGEGPGVRKTRSTPSLAPLASIRRTSLRTSVLGCIHGSMPSFGAPSLSLWAWQPARKGRPDATRIASKTRRA